MLYRLIKIANQLDQKGLYEEASLIDGLIAIAAGMPPYYERPQPEDDEPGETRELPEGPYYEEEWVDPEDAGPTISDKPSQEAMFMTFKNRLSKVLGEKYVEALSEEDMYDLFDEFDLFDVDKWGDSSLTEKIKERVMGMRNEGLYNARLRRGECISCGDDTGPEYLEKDGDPMSPPLCASCIRKDLPSHMEEFVRGQFSEEDLKNLVQLYDVPTETGKIEELVEKRRQSQSPEYPEDEFDIWQPSEEEEIWRPAEDTEY
jgi:hypothetical protein